MPKYQYSRHSGYEVSSKGDARFSALFAIMEDSRTLEMHYQCDIKQYDPGGKDWRAGKGKPPLINISPDNLYKEYLELWKTWANLNPDLIAELKEHADRNDFTLRDSFATSPVNQARALAQILSEKFK